MDNLFTPNQTPWETPNKFYDLMAKDPGGMLAYLKMALRELPEDNFYRQWIVKDINECIAKM